MLAIEAPSSDQASMVQQLKDLAELRNAGVLTDEEFTAQKGKLLG